MRLSTKTKNLLFMYDLSFKMDDEEWITLTIKSKHDGSKMDFSSATYSGTIYKAYSYFLKELKESEKAIDVKPLKRNKFLGDNTKLEDVNTPVFSKKQRYCSVYL